MSYLKVSTGDVLNTNNNETIFSELPICFEEHFEMNVQEGSVLKYINFQIYQSPLDLSIDKTDQIMELVNEFFPTEKNRNLDTHFSTDLTY